MYSSKIQDIKQKYGSSLAILAHHYQSDAIIEHADMVGDSLQLAAAIPGLDAEHIVFCGVDFMAETAAVLAGSHQMIFSPDIAATCVMANMAPYFLVRNVIEKVGAGGKVIPLSYVNSSLGVKSICGRYGGSVCTSSNAPAMLKWAFAQGDRVLFLPDMNLGMNMAELYGLDHGAVQVLDIRNNGNNINTVELAKKQLLLWPGVCAVHFRLKQHNVMEVRKSHPDALIFVHPECNPRVVALADETGSTSKIISFTAKAPQNRPIFIGTEDNLVYRLKREYPDKDINPLGAGYCSNMARITVEKLANCLESMSLEKAVMVDPELAVYARKAVETMLEEIAS